MSKYQSIVRVPGKLMLAGEYAVLVPHQRSVVTAINRFVTVVASSSDDKTSHLTAPNLGLPDITWTFDGNEVTFAVACPQLKLIAEAIFVVFQWLQVKLPTPPLHLKIESQLDHVSGRKLGLGSSAAVVVGVVAAVVDVITERAEVSLSNSQKFAWDSEANRAPHTASDTISREVLFKLSALAHFRAQGSGSGADVAAAVYGGLIRYTAFPASWMNQHLRSGSSIRQILQAPWPCLSISKLTWPSSLSLFVGWTGQAASTSRLVAAITAFRSNHEAVFAGFLKDSAKAVEKLLDGLETQQSDVILESLKLNRKALAELGNSAGVRIETDELKVLADLAESWGGAGKPSGAGGGDCGIAVMNRGQDSVELLTGWTHAGIQPLDIKASQTGMTMAQLPQ